MLLVQHPSCPLDCLQVLHPVSWPPLTRSASQPITQSTSPWARHHDLEHCAGVTHLCVLDHVILQSLLHPHNLFCNKPASLCHPVHLISKCWAACLSLSVVLCLKLCLAMKIFAFGCRVFWPHASYEDVSEGSIWGLILLHLETMHRVGSLGSFDCLDLLFSTVVTDSVAELWEFSCMAGNCASSPI